MKTCLMITLLMLITSCGSKHAETIDVRLGKYWTEFKSLIKHRDKFVDLRLDLLIVGKTEKTALGTTSFSEYKPGEVFVIINSEFYETFKDKQVLKIVLFHEFIHSAFHYIDHYEEDGFLMSTSINPYIVDEAIMNDEWLISELNDFMKKVKCKYDFTEIYGESFICKNR